MKFNFCLFAVSIITFLAFPSVVFAQKGDLFLYNYQIPIKNIDYQNLAAIQGNNGLMYFANKKGILAYDGVSWEIIKTYNTPHSLAVHNSSNGKVYVGCRDNFGYLVTNHSGQEEYKSMSGSYKDFGEIIKIHIEGNLGYFYSDKALFEVHLTLKKVQNVWKADKENIFMGFAFLKGKPYLNIKNKGMHQVSSKGLRKVPKTELYAQLYIHAFVDFGNQVLLCTSNNWGYLFDGLKLQIYLPVAKNYIEGNIIKTAIPLKNNLFAIATLSGGVVLINKQNYATEAIMNYQTGLPDDEVFAMCSDRQGGLWICHAKGISRADLDLPIRLFSGYAGLEGNIETMLSLNDSLYVATSDGLYYLSKVNAYEEIESLIRKEQRYWKTVETINKTVKIQEPRRNTRLRQYIHSSGGRKLEKRKILIEEETEQKRVPINSSSTEVSTLFFKNREARKAYALQSIPFVFRGVNGLQSKCRQLLEFRGKIIASTNEGLFEVIRTAKEISAQPILKDKYINFIYNSPTRKDILYVCTNRGLIILSNQGNTWVVLDDREDEINAALYSIIEHEQTLWLGSESRVFKVKIDASGKVGEAKKYEFKDSYSEDILVRILKGQPAFMLSAGIYSYSPEKDIMYKNPRLQKYFNARSPVFYAQPDYTWIKNTSWQNISQPGSTDFLKTTYFEFFPNIEDVYVDAQGNIWLLDNNAIYQIGSKAQKEQQKDFFVFIRNILIEPDGMVPLSKAVYSYEKQGVGLTFKLSAPFYRNESSIEYQYWLEGLSKEWSDWDTKALISFPYIPSGKYKLHIRARNIFEQTSEEQIYSFRVEPPFWETYWFYGLQISILVGLLLLSFIFSRRGTNHTLSYILTFVSMITVFEFFILLLEPYVENFTNGIPIFKLGMNILLAISLNPIERLLNKWVHKPVKRETGEKTDISHEAEAGEKPITTSQISDN
ncbi:MAG: triple tyrosine motif-containing protein [Microscillaceae bacterium]|nr:triple tyrosine motif-containing protein [Microscillaceae bacterium]